MNELCKKIRSEILTISHKSGHGHVPTSFSIVEMLCAVYQTMRHDPKRPDMPERDLFVLSKGHASLGFYCVLAGHGYFDFEDVYAFGAFDSKFGCHPDRLKVPGVEASTGSLGHGIGLAVGMQQRVWRMRPGVPGRSDDGLAGGDFADRLIGPGSAP